MTKPPKRNNSSRWFECGDEDFRAAVLLEKYDGAPSLACFHAQQAAEKYLKGFLIHNNISPRRIHNLEELAKDCAKINQHFLDHLDDCLFLTRYYIETRYPMPIPYGYPVSEVKEAIDKGQAIIDFVKKSLLL